MLTLMSMTKRIQILVGDQERSRFQAAARRAGLPLAEWVRRQLREKADEVLGGAALGPREALALLKRLAAPIAPRGDHDRRVRHRTLFVILIDAHRRLARFSRIIRVCPRGMAFISV
jgi:hypothetical protein